MSRKTISHEYRDRIYIRKDILLKLFEYGELSQSKLLSYCGLNYHKHKALLDAMVEKNLIIRSEDYSGGKKIVICSISPEGMAILREVLEPYESLFPREKADKDSEDFQLLNKAILKRSLQSLTTEAISSI